MSHRSVSSPLFLAVGVMAIGAVCQSTLAQQRVWDGGGATDNWSDDANWNNTLTGTTGNVWGFSTDTATPAAAVQRTTDMDQSYNLERVQFYGYNDWAINSSSGSTLSLRGGGSAVPAAIFVGSTTNGAAGATISVPISFVARADPDPNPKTIDVRPSSTLVLNNAVSSGTYIVQKAGGGSITFNVASPNFTSEYRIANGTTFLGNDNALGTAVISHSSGNNVRIASATSAVRTLSNNITHGGTGGLTFSQTGGPNMVLDGDITLSGTGSRTFGGGDDVLVTLNGDITGNGVDSIFSKATGATFVLNGNVTGAALTLGNGRIVLNGNQSGVVTTGATPQNTVVQGGALDIYGSHAGNVSVGGGAVRGGGSMRVLSLFDGNTADTAPGGAVSPGNDTVTADVLTAGRADFGNGGRYLFNLNNVATGAGVGWDQIVLNGNGGTPNSNLDITATNGGFLIDIDGAGTAFNANQSYSFPIVDSGGVTGFDLSDFTLDVSGFAPDLMGGSFSLSDANGDLNLIFTPVPEPATMGLLTAAALAVLGRRRRAI
jgi:hypothetical protein